MKPIKTIIGHAVPITIDDVDTDRIIPGRFLRCVTFEGLGKYAFYDERFTNEGKIKDHPMNDIRYKGAKIILSGNNFGCGSSREHAPQALKRAGIEAVIAESFAEIFAGNSLNIGLACIVMQKNDISKLSRLVAETPKENITISIENGTVTFKGVSYPFSIPESAAKALINGTYDLLSELLSNKDKIAKLEKTLSF